MELNEDIHQLITFEYGAMSSKYSIQAENKLTAYVVMCMHYNRNAFAIVIYSPVESKQDSWTSFDGKIAQRLDEIFGGQGSFDKYYDTHHKEIITCYKTIKRVV